MNNENFIPAVIAIYAILLSICIALYALIDISGIDKSLASSLLGWSATIFAPIALLYGLKYWKIQKKQEEKIERLKNLKNIIIDFHIMIDEFRSTSRALFSIQNEKPLVLREKIAQFTREHTALTKKFFFLMNAGEEFFEKEELDKITKLLNGLWDIPNLIDRAYLIVETYALSIPRTGLLRNEYFEYEKNLYLLDPHCWVFQKILNGEEDKKIFEGMEDETFKSLNDLTEYISTLINESYT